MDSDTDFSGSEAAPDEPGFASFGLDPRIVAAIESMGFDQPTPIQREAIPTLLSGRDVLGRARTGSGKTAAFGLPMLERVKSGGRQVRGLVLAPTRELALQVTTALQDFAQKLPVRLVTVYGGASYGPQLSALRDGVSVVVGTPGRVLDYLDRGALDLSQLEMLVLDEADEMLRMGFIDDVERVLQAAPSTCQIALFSATMPDPIRRVANAHLKNPVEVQVESSALSVGHIEQRYVVVPQGHKAEALARVLAAKTEGTTIVFARTRAGAAEASDVLANRGLPVDALHGDLNQGARERVIARLRAGRLGIVVATDVAARGLDIDHVTHVINLDLPPRAEEYVHRIGRTGRAGREGHAISFVTPSEESRLRSFQRMLKVTIAPMDVPSDAAIARARKARLRSQLLEVAAGELPPELSTFIDDLSTEIEPTKVAAALLAIVAESRGLDLHEGSDQPPHWARRFAERRAREQAPRESRRGRHEEDSQEPRARPRGPVPDGDELELVFAVGRARGVRAQDLVGAIANEADVPGSAIGKISIVDRASFVKVPRTVAEHLLKHHRMLIIRGRPVRLDLARGEPPARDRRDERRARDDGDFEERPRREPRGDFEERPRREPRGDFEERPRREAEGGGRPRRDEAARPPRDDEGGESPRRVEASRPEGARAEGARTERSWEDFDAPRDERPRRFEGGFEGHARRPRSFDRARTEGRAEGEGAERPKKPFGKKPFGKPKPGGFAPPKRKGGFGKKR
jgi:ATP-dependent RNA helicase DeaD